MELRAKCYLIGTEKIENKKDPVRPYLRVSVVQGDAGTPDTLSVSSEEIFDKIAQRPRFSEVDLLFEYIQTPKFQIFRIKDLIEEQKNVTKN